MKKIKVFLCLAIIVMAVSLLILLYLDKEKTGLWGFGREAKARVEAPVSYKIE